MAFSLRSISPLPDAAAGCLEAASEPGALAVGATLRCRREALGLDIADVAAALRIKPAYLVALEAGRIDALPGAVYAIGFVRAYADHLGLDGSQVLRCFKRESALLAAKPDLTFPIPLGERSVPGGGMLLVALILAICAYGAWLYMSNDEAPRRERVAEVPLELLPKPQPPGVRPAVSPPREPTGALQPPPGPGFAGAGAASPTMAAPPEPAPAATGAAPDATKEVVIRATADSWIQIRDARQSVLLTRVLKAGESCRAPDRPGLSMRTGNAGGLEITVGGIPAPSIGRRGMVRRNVALDGHALLAGSAVRN
jgi:cytoskeleton protein RodZ